MLPLRIGTDALPSEIEKKVLETFKGAKAVEFLRLPKRPTVIGKIIFEEPDKELYVFDFIYALFAGFPEEEQEQKTQYVEFFQTDNKAKEAILIAKVPLSFLEQQKEILITENLMGISLKKAQAEVAQMLLEEKNPLVKEKLKDASKAFLKIYTEATFPESVILYFDNNNVYKKILLIKSKDNQKFKGDYYFENWTFFNTENKSFYLRWTYSNY